MVVPKGCFIEISTFTKVLNCVKVWLIKNWRVKQMLNNYTGTIYEGNNLKGCCWNVLLEELNYSDQEFKQLIDKPVAEFNHWAYLEALENRGQTIEINQLVDCVQITIL